MRATAVTRRASTEAGDPILLSGFGAVADRYDLLLCDVWGVLHDGLRALPRAGEALSRYRAGGGRVVLVSNAPRPGASVTEQLDRFGVPREAYDAIRTSGDLTRDLVVARGERPFLRIGPERDSPLLDDVPGKLADLEEAEYVVCTGLVDDETETVADYEPTLRRMRERGLTMICANPDIVVERGHRLIVCAGALAAAYEAIGGAVIMAGKPHRPVYEAAFALSARLFGREPNPARTLAVGDALRTDVAGGDAFGIDTLLVARGIHSGDLAYREEEGMDVPAALAWLRDQPVRPTMLADELRWE